MISKKKYYAIIPARGGSTGIKNKNLLNDNKSETIILCSNKKFQDNKTTNCKYITVDEVNEKLAKVSITLL